jgi:hypothetical protein
MDVRAEDETSARVAPDENLGLDLSIQFLTS